MSPTQETLLPLQGGGAGNTYLDKICNPYRLIMTAIYFSFFPFLNGIVYCFYPVTVSQLYALCLYVSLCVFLGARELFYVRNSLDQGSCAQQASPTYGPYADHKIWEFDLDVMNETDWGLGE